MSLHTECWRLIGESNHPLVWEAMALVRAARQASGVEEREMIKDWMYRHNYEEGLTWPGYGPLIKSIALDHEVDVMVIVIDLMVEVASIYTPTCPRSPTWR